MMPRLLGLTLAALLCAAGLAHAGKPFPDLRLPAPKAPEARALGLKAAEAPFRLSELPSEVAIIVVANYFCGPCREEVPKLAELFRLIADRGYSGRVKVLGIMAGDGPELAARFRKATAAPYALFADPDYALHRELGSPLVPQLYVVKLSPRPALLISRSGGFKEPPAKFLDLLLAKAGLR